MCPQPLSCFSSYSCCLLWNLTTDAGIVDVFLRILLPLLLSGCSEYKQNTYIYIHKFVPVYIYIYIFIFEKKSVQRHLPGTSICCWFFAFASCLTYSNNNYFRGDQENNRFVVLVYRLHSKRDLIIRLCHLVRCLKVIFSSRCSEKKDLFTIGELSLRGDSSIVPPSAPAAGAFIAKQKATSNQLESCGLCSLPPPFIELWDHPSHSLQNPSTISSDSARSFKIKTQRRTTNTSVERKKQSNPTRAKYRSISLRKIVPLAFSRRW